MERVTKVAPPAIGRKSVVALGVSGLAFALLYAWWSGCSINLLGRTTVAPVPLHEEPLDVFKRQGPFSGTVPSGTFCRLIQVETKGLVSFRVRCGSLEGWTDEAQSFDPPLGVGLFG